MKNRAFDWVHTLHHAHPELFNTPLWSTPSPLSLETLGDALEQVLKKPAHLVLKPAHSAPDAHTARTSFSQETASVTVKLGNIPSPCELLLHKQDLDFLLQDSLFETPPPITSFSLDPSVLHGYLLFAATKIISLLNDQGFTWGQMLHIEKEPILSDVPVLFQDMELKTNKHTFAFRLIMPVSFAEDLKQKFPIKEEDLLHSEKAKHIPLHLIVQCGNVHLSPSQLKTLQVGDAILLDTFSFDPETKRGLFEVQLQDHVVFHAKTKDDSLKILGFGSHTTQEPLMSAADDDIEFTEDEESFMEESSPEKPEEPLIPLEETSLPLIVEAARLEITLDKLLKLSPGNLLDLSIHPEQGVYLTLHNKRIARGELIRVGENLCFRILDIAKGV